MDPLDYNACGWVIKTRNTSRAGLWYYRCKWRMSTRGARIKLFPIKNRKRNDQNLYACLIIFSKTKYEFIANYYYDFIYSNLFANCISLSHLKYHLALFAAGTLFVQVFGPSYEEGVTVYYKKCQSLFGPI